MTVSEHLGAYSEACGEAFDLIELSRTAVQRLLDISPMNGSFTPIGEIALGGDDMLVYAGLKTRTADSVKRVARELLVGDKLLRHKPTRVDSLPMFTLPVATLGGRDVGVLTEDFTQAGARKLDEQNVRSHGLHIDKKDVPEGLCADVYEALLGNVDAEAFGHMMGWIGHLEVMIDFNDITYLEKDDELQPYEEFARRLTVVVNG